MQEKRFSLLSLAGDNNRRMMTQPEMATSEATGGEDTNRNQEGAEREQTEFEQCVDEIRNILVASKGRTDEEKQQYSEALNRAVLGYEQERGQFLAIVNDQLAKRRMNHIHPPGRMYANLAEAVFAEVIGLNILELVMKNREGLEEIQVVGRDIYEVRNGQASPSPYKFHSIRNVERIQQNLVLFNNEVINPRKRWAEVSLKDGSRVTLTGFGFTAEPTLTIRFYTMKYFNLHTLCHADYGTMNDLMRRIVQVILSSCFNMVVTGPTNSGKTNLIKALIAELPDNERLITIESRYELMLKRDFPSKNIIEYEVDEEDRLHAGSQAFKLALRQSPKRICHAEIRDDDANLYVRACTRGHEGSITSVHVNALEDVPDAITDMCMLDGRGMNPDRLTKRITQYVTQIGFEMGVVEGRRKLLRIGEFTYENDAVRVRDIVRYDYAAREWMYPDKLSRRAAARMNRLDSDGYMELLKLERVEPC